MSYTVTLPAKPRSAPDRWAKTYKIVLAVAAYIALVALITLAQVANDKLASDVNAPFTASGSQAF